MSRAILIVLSACSPPPDATPPVSDPAATPDPATPGDETPTEPPAVPAPFAPDTFTLGGVFAYDPDEERLVEWEGLLTGERPHLSFVFTDHSVDPAVDCVVEMGIATSGTAAPRLGAWDFEDTVWGGFGSVQEALHHVGFFATADGFENGCPAVDPAVWGTDDLTEVLGAWQWGIGFGEVRSDHLDEATDTLLGGSIGGDLVASGSPPVDAVGWATAAGLDADHQLRTDIWGRAILFDAADVIAADPPLRAVYRVDAAIDWATTALRP